MILISDTGGTKSDWALIQDDGQVSQFCLPGFNPVSQSHDSINALMEGVRLQMAGMHVDHVHYYGTGIINLEIVELIKNAISASVEANQISVVTDLIGAVKATCGREPGIVAIAGTGSNVCQFDGVKIESVTPSLGYPLGDEGSGVDIGKKMVKAHYYHELPADIASEMAKLLPMDRSKFLIDLKMKKAQNQYLASFAKVAMDHLDAPLIKSIVRGSLRELFERHISKYKKGQTVHFVGSIAFNCQPFLKQLIDEYGFVMGKFVKSPMEGLINYHKKELEHVR